jgi:SAM-dependent methyltransferase
MVTRRTRPGRLTGYTTSRIAQSDHSVNARLVHCAGLRSGVAFDIGCGAGYDSFALGAQFSRVWAIDSSRRAIKEGRRAARLLNVTNVTFQQADAEVVLPSAMADLVWCNLMSHNVNSRRYLVRRLASALVPGGWLMYSEISEGYALREIAQAIDSKDEVSLRARVYQVIAGIFGRPTFRFFKADTIQAELARLSLNVQMQEREHWRGLTVVDRVYARRTSSTLLHAPPGEDRDYTRVPPILSWLRAHARAWLASTSRPITESDLAQLRVAVTSSDEPAAMLLLVLPMATELGLPSHSRIRRFAALGTARLRLREPDWPCLVRLNDYLLSFLS